MSVWELYTQLFVRNWKCGRFQRSLSQGCSEKNRKKDVVMIAERWSSWTIQIPQLLMLWWPPRPKKARQSKYTHKLLMIHFFWQHWHDLHALDPPWTDNQQAIICWGFKGVQEEIPPEETSTLQIGSVAFPPEQCTSPQLYLCHKLFDQDGHQDSSSPSQ